jgi:K+-transporting ATPase ATPase B chain
MRPGISMLNAAILRRATGEAFVKLNPRHMMRNPVMFVVEIGSLITTIEFFAHPEVFSGLIAAWLWATVLFANFAEAVAEGRGKAQADALRRTRQDTMARVIVSDGTAVAVPPGSLKVGDRCVVVAGEIIPGDGDVIEGIATVDESAITGESAPVIRESGGDRCAVTGARSSCRTGSSCV